MARESIDRVVREACALWGVVGCAALHEPPVKRLEPWQPGDRAVLGLGD
jgi:hypothetical protein